MKILSHLRSSAGPASASKGSSALTCAVAAALTVFFFLPQPANAQWVSTKELVDNFCEDEAAEESAFCAGYVAGALHVLMAPPELMPTGQFCIEVDKQPKLSAIADRLTTLRKEQPELEDTPAFTVIAAIIERGFPCPEDIIDPNAPTIQQPAAQAPAPAAPQEPSTPSDLFGLPSSE
ncbi:hypothetical protein BN1012_Phect655 [Candidatus Phaeomarinobacter ectocarpi]|uniref:Rap1a immunity protein domain-containing protein n=1 Tax=Candidatus Phaeomarinibacter ectocarpi TaxID=1458461 RepID=X5MDX7_9HYPH|nr:Rap1a/Tai family immunity protein [Candidatus Phaeomarinobacter ectocarpi]CDO58869.1 hypothetical protein BN1012_Phect655 [Candidatus Phaeomarinobacter ectocarpi]